MSGTILTDKPTAPDAPAIGTGSAPGLAPASAGQLRRVRRRTRAGLTIGMAIAGVAAVAIVLSATPLLRPTPTALPAMDAGMGFWDRIDTRPAVSRSDTSMGFWDRIDTRPAVSRSDMSMGFWDYIDTRPAVRELPAMPASLGYWDFVTVPERPSAPAPARGLEFYRYAPMSGVAAPQAGPARPLEVFRHAASSPPVAPGQGARRPLEIFRYTGASRS